MEEALKTSRKEKENEPFSRTFRRPWKEVIIDKIKTIFATHRSQPLHEVVKIINPILRGWVEYFRIGNSAKVFGSIKDWLNKKMRRHLMRSKGRQGFGWKRWSTTMLWSLYNVYSDFHVRYWKASPVKKAV